MNGVIIPSGNIKTKQVSFGTSGTLTPTAVNYGHVATLFGVPNLTQDDVLSVMAVQTTLTPASCLVFSMYSNNLFVAATQNTTLSGSITVNVVYKEP